MMDQFSSQHIEQTYRQSIDVELEAYNLHNLSVDEPDFSSKIQKIEKKRKKLRQLCVSSYFPVNDYNNWIELGSRSWKKTTQSMEEYLSCDISYELLEHRAVAESLAKELQGQEGKGIVSCWYQTKLSHSVVDYVQEISTLDGIHRQHCLRVYTPYVVRSYTLAMKANDYGKAASNHFRHYETLLLEGLK